MKEIEERLLIAFETLSLIIIILSIILIVMSGESISFQYLISYLNIPFLTLFLIMTRNVITNRNKTQNEKNLTM